VPPIKGKGYVDRYQRLIMVDRAMVPSDGDNSRAGCSPAVIVTPHECCNLCESREWTVLRTGSSFQE
jgi:hypothetical protein